MNLIRILIVAALCIGSALTVALATSKYGPAINSDSLNYINASQGLVHGEGLYRYTGELFTHWPPLYPSVLAVLSIISPNIWFAALLLNVSIAALVTLASYKLFAYFLDRPLVLYLSTTTVAFSIPLFFVYMHVWSEPLFILLTVIFLLCAVEYIQAPARWSLLLLMATIAMLASLQRYTGVTLIMVGCLLIVGHPERPIALWMRTQKLIVFGLISSVPLSLWLARNWFLTETLTGPRPTSTASIFENIYLTVGFMVVGWSAMHFEWWVLEVLAFINFMLLVGGVAYAYKLAGIPAMPPQKQIAIIAPVVMFLGIYLGFLLWSATAVGFNSIGHRLLSPVYVPYILLISLIIHDALGKLPQDKTAYLFVTITFIIAMGIVPIYRNVEFAAKLAQNGGVGFGFNSTPWHTSETVTAIRSLPPDVEIYSNFHPGIICFFTGRRAEYSPDSTEAIADFEAMLSPDDQNYLVWLKRIGQHTPGLEDTLRERFNLQLLHELEDGRIYLIQVPPNQKSPAVEGARDMSRSICGL